MSSVRLLGTMTPSAALRGDRRAETTGDIEADMKKLLKKNAKFEQSSMSIEEARDSEGRPYYVMRLKKRMVLSKLKDVFAASAAALVFTSAIGVLAGSLISEYVNPRVMRWVAGLGFIAVGLWVLVSGESQST